MAYAQLEPFGPPAEFWRIAAFMALYANAHKKKGKKTMKPEDFMPKSLVDEPVGSKDVAARILAAFQAMAAAGRRR